MAETRQWQVTALWRLRAGDHTDGTEASTSVVLPAWSDARTTAAAWNAGSPPPPGFDPDTCHDLTTEIRQVRRGPRGVHVRPVPRSPSEPERARRGLAQARAHLTPPESP